MAKEETKGTGGDGKEPLTPGAAQDSINKAKDNAGTVSAATKAGETAQAAGAAANYLTHTDAKALIGKGEDYFKQSEGTAGVALTHKEYVEQQADIATANAYVDKHLTAYNDEVAIHGTTKSLLDAEKQAHEETKKKLAEALAAGTPGKIPDSNEKVQQDRAQLTADQNQLQRDREELTRREEELQGVVKDSIATHSLKKLGGGKPKELPANAFKVTRHLPGSQKPEETYFTPDAWDLLGKDKAGWKKVGTAAPPEVANLGNKNGI